MELTELPESMLVPAGTMSAWSWQLFGGSGG
jgi:hypothetical protein